MTAKVVAIHTTFSDFLWLALLVYWYNLDLSGQKPTDTNLKQRKLTQTHNLSSEN